MTSKINVGKELKALGFELVAALKQIRSSKEFKDLEKEVGKSIKSISSSLGRSLKAAKASPSTEKIKKRMGRVVKAGTVQGTKEARKAQAAAIKGLRKVVKSMKNLSKNLEP